MECSKGLCQITFLHSAQTSPTKLSSVTCSLWHSTFWFRVIIYHDKMIIVLSFSSLYVVNPNNMLRTLGIQARLFVNFLDNCPPHTAADSH